jgi:prepilin-type N-terminal cleavage/methylation domain-containing protein
VIRGAPRRAGARTRWSAGFTLLELVVALFVLALATALAMPAIGRGTEGIRARAEATRFSALLRHTREQAITVRKPHEVVVDPETRRVSVKAGRDEARTALTLAERVKIQANPPPALTVRFEPYGSSTGGDFLLTSATFRYHVTIDAITGRVRTERAP